jgi:hypothetical protein
MTPFCPHQVAYTQKQMQNNQKKQNLLKIQVKLCLMLDLFRVLEYA